MIVVLEYLMWLLSDHVSFKMNSSIGIYLPYFSTRKRRKDKIKFWLIQSTVILYFLLSLSLEKKKK